MFVDAGFYSIGNYDGSFRTDTPPRISIFAVDANASSSSNGRAAGAGRPDDDRGVAFRSGVAVCPAGWYCTGDGGGSQCPPGLYGSEVGNTVPARGLVRSRSLRVSGREDEAVVTGVVADFALASVFFPSTAVRQCRQSLRLFMRRAQRNNEERSHSVSRPILGALTHSSCLSGRSLHDPC